MAVTDRRDSRRAKRKMSEQGDAGKTDERLSEQFADVFTLILKLRATSDYGEADKLRRRIKDLLDRTEREALSAGETPEAIRAVKFGLVAFIDETILASDWPQKSEWSNTPLQLELFDRYDAGEVFFDRLDKFLDDPELYAEELEVYYLCLALGFKGQYRIHEQEKLHERIEETADALSRLPDMRTDTLSPHGLPDEQVTGEVRQSVPTWVIAVAALVVGVFIYVGMYLYISASAHDVAQAIQQMTG